MSLLLTRDGSKTAKTGSLEIKIPEALPPAYKGLSRHKDIVQPFRGQILVCCSEHLFSVNIAYLTNQRYGMDFKIPAKRFSCEIQRVCDSFLSGKRSVVPVGCDQSPTLHYSYYFFSLISHVSLVKTN